MILYKQLKHRHKFSNTAVPTIHTQTVCVFRLFRTHASTRISTCDVDVCSSSSFFLMVALIRRRRWITLSFFGLLIRRFCHRIISQSCLSLTAVARSGPGRSLSLSKDSLMIIRACVPLYRRWTVGAAWINER